MMPHRDKDTALEMTENYNRASMHGVTVMYITHWQIYALKVHVHKYSSVSFTLTRNLVLIEAGAASLNALSITG